MPTISETLCDWFLASRFEDLPSDVVANTKLHLLDQIGLMLATSAMPYGRIVRDGVLPLGGGSEARILGFGDRTSAATAVIANGAMADALDFDDTHNETHLHPGAHVVPSALTVGEMTGASGRDIVTAIALGMEAGSRLAVAAPGMFVKHGLHSSAIVGTITTTMIAARLLGLDRTQTLDAVGTAGSQAGGILQCYEDGTWTQGLHPGWAAHAGLAAAYLGRAGFPGPREVLEGRRGLFRSHIQDEEYVFDFSRTVADLGIHWESRHISLKPYPTGCVIHPYLDAILHLTRSEGLRVEDVDEIVMPISHHWVPVVCEPIASKQRPPTEMAARISLHWAVAEALYCGKLGLDAFSEENLANPSIIALAERTRYVLDPDPPPRRDFKGWVIVNTRDGRRFEHVEFPWSRGHHGNADTPRLVADKFRATAGIALPEDAVRALADTVEGVERVTDVRKIVDLCVAK